MNYEISIADVIALAVSTFAVYISVKNRKNSLRENLYNRQLDAFIRLIGDLADIEEYIDDYLIQIEYEKSESDLTKDLVLKKINEFYSLELKSSIIMPNKIDAETYKVSSKLSSIHKSLYKGELTREDSEELGNKIFDLEEEIRSFIGLEKLSKENQRITRTLGKIGENS